MRLRQLSISAALLCGCAFNPPELAGDVGDAAHLPPSAAAVGAGDLILAEDVRILTGPGVPEIVDTSLPEGASFTTSAQDPSGDPEVAVLHVAEFAIEAGVIVRAQGSRPLIIVADTVRIAGILDASASLAQPGAGGAEPGAGPGAGETGLHVDDFEDGGGGGGSFSQLGGKGGDAVCQTTCVASGGAPGRIYGDVVLSVLQGGSGGGFAGDDCRNVQPPPGAGGGAVQISARRSITVASGAGINAGGGGGGGGQNCGLLGAGGGGGSGGAIYLQAPRVVNDGILAANGGGGGGGSGSPDGSTLTAMDGGNGSNGLLAVQGAPGGSGFPFWGKAGGVGAFGTTAAGPGGTEETVNDGNGGGGGGGPGYIVVVTATGLMDGSGQSSPGARVGSVVGQ